MFEFGLKLWSNNEDYLSEAIRLYNMGYYQFLEIYIIPNTFENFNSKWITLDIPYIIHATHFTLGMNLAVRNYRKQNLQFADEAILWAKALNAGCIIFHPGVNGKIEETAKQLKEINKRNDSGSKILIENKPFYGLGENLSCNGYSIDEILYIKEETGAGFCLDVGHAICAANVLKIVQLEFIKDFINLYPDMYHLSDGDFNGIYDRHDHFGKGTYPVSKILEILPEGSKITIETEKDFKDSLDDFLIDLEFLKNI